MSIFGFPRNKHSFEIINLDLQDRFYLIIIRNKKNFIIGINCTNSAKYSQTENKLENFIE